MAVTIGDHDAGGERTFATLGSDSTGRIVLVVYVYSNNGIRLLSGWMAWLAFCGFSTRNDFGDSTFGCEHVLAVPPDDYGGYADQEIRVVGLRIWKDRVHEREVEKRRQENTATRPIE